MAYIYIIKNHINSKCYVGLTTRNITIRFKEHLKLLESSRNQLIHKAIKKYGKENFYIELLEECDENIMSEREQYYISFYDTIMSGYNLTNGGLPYAKFKSIDKEQILEICNYYKIGLSLRDLSQKYSISRDKLTQLLIENNIEIRSKSCRIINPQILKIDEVKEYLSSGKSYAEIARIYNVAGSSVRKFVIKHNLKNIIQ